MSERTRVIAEIDASRSRFVDALRAELVLCQKRAAAIAGLLQFYVGADDPDVQDQAAASHASFAESVPQFASPRSASPRASKKDLEPAKARLERALAQPGATVVVDKTQPQPDLIEIPIIDRVEEPAPPKAQRIIDVPEPERRVPRFMEVDKPATPKRVTASKTTQAAPAPGSRKAVPGRLNLIPVGPIAIDETANVVAGPKGEWEVSRPCLIILKRLALLQPGQLLGTPNLAAGTMAAVRIEESLPLWRRKLAEIGIELGSLGPKNLFLKRMDA